MGTLIKSKSLLREFEKTQKMNIKYFLALTCTAKSLPIEVVVPDIDYYTNSCQAKINEIEMSIRSPRSKWTKKSTPLGEFIYRKKHCQRLTYDMQFCTMVCALQDGESCRSQGSPKEHPRSTQGAPKEHPRSTQGSPPLPQSDLKVHP